MRLNKPEIWLNVGETDKIVPCIANGETGAGAGFEIAGDKIIELGADGTVKALKPGNTAVKVTDAVSGCTDVCHIKVYPKRADILITVPVWGDPSVINETQFKRLRDAGIDGVMAVGHDNTRECERKMLESARNIWDDSLENNLGVFDYAYLQGITPSSTDREIADYVDRNRHTPALLGYHIEDEPFDLNPYARIVRLFQQNDPCRIADVNFLPGGVYGSFDTYGHLVSDYGKLTKGYASYLSFDCYPFGLKQGSFDEGSWFGNLETIRKAGLENDMGTASYLQSVGSAHYGYRRPDENELRYDMASALAYGFKWLKYYSWFVPGAAGTGEADQYTDAVLDKNGNKTDLYGAASRLNRQVHNVGEVLCRLGAAEVYHSGAKSTGSAYEKVTPAFVAQPAGDCHAILSLMIDRDTGEQYLMIVNKDFENRQNMSFKLKNVGSVYELDKDKQGGTLPASYSGGVLTRAFLPGEFALFRLSDSADHRSVPEKPESAATGTEDNAGRPPRT